MSNTCFTFPSTSPGRAAWVADPSCRGTNGIASLCFSTTLICIWSSIHRDIPLKHLPIFRSLLRDVPLVLVALFAPEVLFYFSLNQFLCARYLVNVSAKSRNFRVRSDEPSEPRNQDPSTEDYLGMDDIEIGSLLLQDRTVLDNTRITFDSSLKDCSRQHLFTLRHGSYATMGGFALKSSVGDDGSWSSRPLKLTTKGVAFLMEHEPNLIPDLPLGSIVERSKSNSLGKMLLIVQVAWFCLNCVSRLAERLPLSLLEVSTLAHGLFTLSSYAMWWSKPLNIDKPTWISPRGDHAKELIALLQAASSRKEEERRSLDVGEMGRPSGNTNSILALAQRGYCRYLIPNAGADAYVTFESVPRFNSFLFDTGLSFTFDNTVYERVLDYIVSSFVPLIYGLVHFLALNAQFPTSIERDLWRISSVVIMISGALAVTSEIIVDVTDRASRTPESLRKAVRRVSDLVWNIIIPFIYTICSGYLLVESIRQLWYLPHDAYVVVSWTYYIPHWA